MAHHITTATKTKTNTTPTQTHYIYIQVTSVGKWTGLFNPLYGPDLAH